MSNFLENGRFQIGGKGKAMVIADSRANAVRYYFAIKEYMKNHPQESQGCDVLVAFSGTVKVDDVEYTEAGLNVDENGQAITSDKKFRKAFRSEKYNILVVANKFDLLPSGTKKDEIEEYEFVNEKGDNLPNTCYSYLRSLLTETGIIENLTPSISSVTEEADEFFHALNL